ncbi:hypothetical protein ACHAPI_005242 [Fusarium lateritium]
MPDTTESNNGRKRARQPTADTRYPRKRSLKACHVCRARKTKCDNAQPTCGFCASLNIPCSYDNSEKDHSSFDPASLEILRQLGQIISSQNELAQTVHSIATSHSHAASSLGQDHNHLSIDNGLQWDDTTQAQQLPYVTDWLGSQSDSASTTPAASASVAAVRWFGILATDASNEAFPEVDAASGLDGELLDPSPEGQAESDITPLQRATRIIDTQPSERDLSNKANTLESSEEMLWKAPESISLLDQEQALFQNFLHRICSWVSL